MTEFATLPRRDALGSVDQLLSVTHCHPSWPITLLKQDSIQQHRGHIHIAPTPTPTRRRQVHTPTQPVHIQELLSRATAPHGLILIATTNINPVHCRSRLLPNQLLLYLRMRNGRLLSLPITPHTPAILRELLLQVAHLAAHTKNSPTSKVCLPKSVRPIPPRHVQLTVQLSSSSS